MNRGKFPTEDEISKLKARTNISKEKIIELYEVFKGYDTDNDGFIDIMEIGVINKAFEEGNLDEKALQKWAFENRFDSDYSVNFEGFLNLNNILTPKKLEIKRFPKSDIEKEIHHVFLELDKDGDGFISADELKKGIIESIEGKIHHLIHEADADGDGQLDFTEFRNASLKQKKNQPLVPPKPPDGGWGWVIVFSTFMCNFIIDGFGYSMGVLINPFVKYYGSNDSTVSWASSLFNGLTFVFGPIIGGLSNKYGLRPICMVGSLVTCIGLGLSTLSPNVTTLLFTIGVIGGFGASLTSLPANIAIGYYFETRRALATGISQCGSGVGQFIIAPLITFLVNNYGWKVGIAIVAGMCLTCIFFGALIRPLEIKKDNLQPRSRLKAKISNPGPFFSQRSEDEKCKEIVRPLSRKDSFYNGPVSKLMESNGASSTWDDFRHLLIPSTRPLLDNKDGQSIWILFKDMTELELLMKPAFLLVGASGFFSMIGFFVPLFFLPDMAIHKGIDSARANFLISIYGIFNIVGKLVTGRFSDISCIDSFLLSNTYIFMSGVSAFFLPLCYSYELFVPVVAFYGFFTTFFMLKTIILVELLGLDNLTSAYSLIAFFEGIASIVGAPISGTIGDVVGSYDISFYIAGGFFILSSLCGFAAQVLDRHKKRNRLK